MGNRKALLIGVETTGEGFAPLPAVREDIKLIGGALEAVGYEAALCPPEVLSECQQARRQHARILRERRARRRSADLLQRPRYPGQQCTGSSLKA